MRSLTVRLAGFAGAPIVSALAPFIILPVISRVVGADGWANFSTGQSIGTLGMVLVLFGWGVSGPVQVARSTTAHARATILLNSLRSRALTALAATPLAAVITYFVSGPAFRLESVLIAAVMTLGGLSPSWYCIGEGNPRGLMVYDALPKIAASLIAMPIILWSRQPIWYPVLLAVTTLPAVFWHARTVLRDHRDTVVPQRVLETLRTLVPTASIDATANAYASTPIPIATAGLAPAAASGFASADRVYRIGMLAVIALGNAFQGWVLTPDAEDPHRRHRLAILAHAALGIVGGALIAGLGPLATTIVFGPAVAASFAVSVPFGIAFAALSASTPLIRNILIPDHRYRTVLAATIAGAAVGLAVMTWGAFLHRAGVIGIGVAAAECIVLAVLIVPARRAYPRVVAAVS